MSRRLLTALGAGSSMLATLSALGCCGLGILGPAGALVAAVPVAAMIPASWAYESLYVSLGLAGATLALNARRHRRWLPLTLGLAGGSALLIALHEAWDVEVFRLLVLVGSASLLAGVISDVGATRCGRSRLGRS